MNILFDGNFTNKPKSGIHRYFFNLVKNLPSSYIKYSTTTETNSDITNHFIPPLKHFRPHKFSYIFEYFWYKRFQISTSFDLVHSAYFNLSKPCIDLISKGTPHIITVHDLIHELFSKNKINIINCRRKILENATAIITVSESTRNDLLNTYKSIPKDKVHVVHHGINNNQSVNDLNLKVPKEFLLYVGHREGYKNFDSLLPHIQKIKKIKRIPLIVVGPKPSKNELDNIKNRDLIAEVIFLVNISDQELNYLYSKCLALLFPSLYEGFGFPILEAMSFGAIPFASRGSSIHEVMGDAGVYVEVCGKSNLCDLILNISQNPKKKKTLKNKSKKRALEFSWSKCARLTTSIYAKTINNN